MNPSAIETSFQIQDLVTMFLHRVPHVDHENISRVCSQWRNIVTDNSGFLQWRRESEWDEPLLLVFKATEVEDEDDDDDEDSSDSEDEVDEGFQSVVRLVDPGTGRWRSVAPLPQPRLDHCSAFVGGALYTIGGCDASYKPQGYVHRYDVMTDTWTECAPLNEVRTGACCGVVGGGIVVAGGWCGGSHLSSVEFYDPQTNTWEFREPMSSARGWANACVLPGAKVDDINSTDRLCMLGGAADDVDASNDFPEVYDHVKDKWTVLPRAETSVTGGRSMHPLAHPRSGLVLMGLGGGSEEAASTEILPVTAVVLDESASSKKKTSEDVAAPCWRELDGVMHEHGDDLKGLRKTGISTCLALGAHRSVVLSHVADDVVGDQVSSDLLLDLRSNTMTAAPWSLPMAGTGLSCAVVHL